MVSSRPCFVRGTAGLAAVRNRSPNAGGSALDFLVTPQLSASAATSCKTSWTGVPAGSRAT
eukprot:518532-Pyramimonas_sp.AAC.1